MTDIASYVNRFVQSVCGHQTAPIRGEIRAAANISLNEIFKKEALVVNQRFVHLMKCVQVQKNATDVSGNKLFDWLHFFASTVVLRIPLLKTSLNPYPLCVIL